MELKLYDTSFSIAKSAVAEYIAATRGLTLRKRLVGATYAPKI